MVDDFELLRAYAERGEEDAFRALVERHAAMVYGTAVRVLGNASLAEETTQATFILLARKVCSLRRGTIVAGWLYRTARFVALETRRAEQRRQQRQDSFGMNDSEQPPWQQISPLLDEAMARLREKERDAVVLRFFEGKSFAELSKSLGTTEAAAKMRVARALEKLRGSLAREGLTISLWALTSAVEANAAPAPPAHLSASTSSAALASIKTNAPPAALVKAALKVMAWNKVKSAAAAAVVILLLGGGTVFVAMKYQHHNARPVTVSTFEPMAGEWEGTFVMSGDGKAEPVKQTVALSIRTERQGRSCEIEMRVLAPGGGVGRVYHFTHSINEAGDRILTVDDPSVAGVSGEGVVTTSFNDRSTGEWHAAFHAVLPDGRGSTDCEWIRKDNELSIVRRDRTEQQGRVSEGLSELRLRKVAANRVAL